jgi:hypothetical protein
MAVQDELQNWYQQRQALINKYGGLDNLKNASQEEADVFNGKTLSPEAQQFKTQGGGGQVFNADTGQFEKQKGLWSNPITWAQIAGAGGLAALPILAGVGAASAIGGGSGAAAGGGGAATGAGAGTAASVAGSAAAPAAKAAGSWLTGPTASLIGTGIGLGGQIWGAHEALAAQDKAAELQDKQFQAALAQQKEEQQYNRNQYADYLARLQGYGDTGNAANARLAAFMGQPAPTNAPNQYAAMVR